MQLTVFDDYPALSRHAAQEILMLVKQKPDAVLCLASGNTPALTYELLVQEAITARIDFSSCTFIGLDEWMGIPPDNAGSCASFFKKHLFDHLNFSASQIHLFNGLANNPGHECAMMDQRIFEADGIDLMLVGIGMNGHIGFNEPGTSFDLYSHVARLDETTTSVGQKYFKTPTTLSRGFTLGLKHLLESRRLLLLANGKQKAAIVHKALQGETGTSLPASVIRSHSNSATLLDKEAASALV